MSQPVDHSLSLANPTPPFLDNIQKIAAAIGGIGLLILFIAWFGNLSSPQPTLLWSALILMTVGTIIYAWRAYMIIPEGIKNNGNWLHSLTNRGLWGWITGIIITGFYVCLYYYPALLGYSADGNTGFVALFDPLSQLLKGQDASQWFLYGTLYTLAILIFGVKFIFKYRHNQYQVIRTISVMFFQLAFAFLLPEFLLRLNLPYNDFKNMWPLNYYFFYDWNIQGFLNGGSIGMFMLVWGVLMIFLVSPVLTYFYGKRWYCSWVCGCGGLAETAGDPWRHLSDKSLTAWKIERWLIHSVLVFAVVMTVAVLYSFFNNQQEKLIITKPMFVWGAIGLMVVLAVLVYIKREQVKQMEKNLLAIIFIILGLIVGSLAVAQFSNSSNVFLIDSYDLRKQYGFLIGATFSGVIGVGFYPIMGSRVWCRFGCPMAAILGIQQRFFSRFRITTNGGQCISCGNCSTYCEMGIDVRSYAQKGQNIVRASCVGCGICAAVCPRGVLKLENGAVDISSRTDDLKAIHITEDQVKILS